MYAVHPLLPLLLKSFTCMNSGQPNMTCNLTKSSLAKSGSSDSIAQLIDSNFLILISFENETTFACSSLLEEKYKNLWSIISYSYLRNLSSFFRLALD